MTDTAQPTAAATGRSLEHRLARLEAVQEIHNLMGRYSNWHSANMHRECLDLFALSREDVSAEMMWGVYEGRESLERLYPGFHVWADGDARGKMHMHTLTTPVIEVADDLRTARGTWVSPGLETMSFVEDAANDAFWAWCKYGADFILEDGVWKIWHLHVFGLFMTPYDRPWTEDPSDHGDPPMPDEFLPDKPPTTHWMYAQDRVYPNEPAPPAPYASFNPTDRF
ncbi:nuclear transport factor 2 family protein [Demequina pelophila]|uniref:nuclear transport factor 2 family protein n=1 Tax=Demequina pelophila TaxID=1638984 RepID=UPI00078383E7|nr:nuclear transport factor 2 family protein [Demequina pelophila]